MKKTPQEIRRDTLREVFDRILGKNKTILSPISISVSEGALPGNTVTNFSFKRTEKDRDDLISISELDSQGFVDGIFTGLHKSFSKEFTSLSKLRLVNFMVNPQMSASLRKLRTDARTSVVFKVNAGRSDSDFQHDSRSVIHSSFCAALEVFQFYANCERSFDQIQIVLDDANRRNRGDIAQACKFDLSRLTEINTYEKKRKS